MISRRRLLLTGAALGGTALLAACGSTEPVNMAALPDYSGKGDTTQFDGAWIGNGMSTWQLDVQNGVFTAKGAGKGLSSWTGAMTGYIRKDHTLEGSARSGDGSAVYPVDGTWPRLQIHWSDGPPSVIRVSKA